MNFRIVHLLRLRHALQEQHHGAPDRRHVDGLVRRIQHKHRLLHQRCTPRHDRVVGSTVRGIRGTGRSGPSRLGGIAPSEIDRLWPVCAHRATFVYSLPFSGAGKGFLTARATVSPMTHLTPESSRALAHASSVAPVVITSSTSKTR